MKSASRCHPVDKACRILAIVVFSLLFNPACKSPNDQIVVCGERLSIGTPVVLWSDSGGYDAYATAPALPETGAEGLRYKPGRSWADADRPLSRSELAAGIDLFVLHYDVCGFSRRCFEVLHNKRGLSVHFLLDVDGTLYQTLDLREQAWHGREVNPRSIGIEIANIGAYPNSTDQPPQNPYNADQLPEVLHKWYAVQNGALFLKLPADMASTQIRSPGPFRSNRSTFVSGPIHGKNYFQADFTPQQYAALSRLARGLNRALPRIRLDAPRDAAGAVRSDKLSSEELAGFSGIIGHYHITTSKIDPGPAFDWESFLKSASR